MTASAPENFIRSYRQGRLVYGLALKTAAEVTRKTFNEGFFFPFIQGHPHAATHSWPSAGATTTVSTKVISSVLVLVHLRGGRLVTSKGTHLVIQLKIGIHLEARVKGFDSVSVAAIAVVQEADPVPKPCVLEATRNNKTTQGNSGDHEMTNITWLILYLPLVNRSAGVSKSCMLAEEE